MSSMPLFNKDYEPTSKSETSSEPKQETNKRPTVYDTNKEVNAALNNMIRANNERRAKNGLSPLAERPYNPILDSGGGGTGTGAGTSTTTGKYTWKPKSWEEILADAQDADETDAANMKDEKYYYDKAAEILGHRVDSAPLSAVKNLVEKRTGDRSPYLNTGSNNPYYTPLMAAIDQEAANTSDPREFKSYSDNLNHDTSAYWDANRKEAHNVRPLTVTDPNPTSTGFGTGNFAGVTNEDLGRDTKAEPNPMLGTGYAPGNFAGDWRDQLASMQESENATAQPAQTSSHQPTIAPAGSTSRGIGGYRPQPTGVDLPKGVTDFNNTMQSVYGNTPVSSYVPESNRSRPPVIETPDWNKPGTGFGTGNFAGLTNEALGRGTKKDNAADEINAAYEENFGQSAPTEPVLPTNRRNYSTRSEKSSGDYGKGVERPQEPAETDRPSQVGDSMSRALADNQRTTPSVVNTHVIGRGEPVEAAYSRWLREDMDKGMNLDQILLAAQQSGDFYDTGFYYWIVNMLNGADNRTQTQPGPWQFAPNSGGVRSTAGILKTQY